MTQRRRSKANRSWKVYEISATRHADGGYEIHERVDTLGIVKLPEKVSVKDLRTALIDLLGYHHHKDAPVLTMDDHGSVILGFENGKPTFELVKQDEE